MTSSHVVIGARKWATHYDPMGEGPAGALYGFTGPYSHFSRFAEHTPAWWLDIVYDRAELDLIDNPLAYPSRHAVDHE